MSRLVDFDQIKLKRKIEGRRRSAIALGGILFALLVGLGVFVFAGSNIFQTLLSPVSFVVQLVTPVQLKMADGRVNFLILGLDTRNTGGETGLLNTDTILIASFSPTEGRGVLVSIPRDLWINLSPSGYGRINAAYSLGGTKADGNFEEKRGVEFSKKKIEEVLGISLPYFVVVDLSGFKEIVDTLGGVNVCVERAFDDYSYPLPGRENAPLEQRYKRVHFEAGCQLMNGETALAFVRSRTGTGEEGSDFARVRRQQKVILAIREKALSLNLVFDSAKIVKLYQQFSRATKTNVTLGEARKMLEFAGKFGGSSKIESLVLDPESGLVYHPDPEAFGGAYVLLPTGGNYSKIQEAVRKLILK